MKIFWWRLILYFKLWYLQKTIKWEVSLDLLIKLAYLVDERLLQDYNPSLGKRIRFCTSFSDAIISIAWLDKAIQLVRKTVPTPDEIGAKYVPDYMLEILDKRKNIALDDFLLPETGLNVTLTDYLFALRERLCLLQEVLNVNQSDPEFGAYYPRKFQALYPDYFAILEGLLKAALSSEEEQ